MKKGIIGVIITATLAIGTTIACIIEDKNTKKWMATPCECDRCKKMLTNGELNCLPNFSEKYNSSKLDLEHTIFSHINKERCRNYYDELIQNKIKELYSAITNVGVDDVYNIKLCKECIDECVESLPFDEIDELSSIIQKMVDSIPEIKTYPRTYMGKVKHTDDIMYLYSNQNYRDREDALEDIKLQAALENYDIILNVEYESTVEMEDNYKYKTWSAYGEATRKSPL